MGYRPNQDREANQEARATHQAQPQAQARAGRAQQERAQQERPQQEQARQERSVADTRAAEAQARIAELEDQWRRALAELDNVRKRAVRDLQRERARERAVVAAEWLPLIDDLERALTHAESDPSAIIEGVRSVRDQAVKLLERLGYPRHDETGVPFDPARHAAVGTRADTGAPSGTVVEVVRPGYGDGENQLRPALVMVAVENG